MSNKLAFLDLDRTLIDSNYELNMPLDEFRAFAETLQSKGVSVGLCSDSAVITLRQWQDKLGLKGPIVAERGAVIWDSEQNTELILDFDQTEWFSDFRKDFISELMRNFPQSSIFIGDATHFFKSSRGDLTSSQIFAINGFRKASFSFFALKMNQEKKVLEPDSDLLVAASLIAEKLLSHYKKAKNDLFWDENPEYGILILHDKDTHKRAGISKLISQLLPNQTVMVGDSMSDFLDLPEVLQFAVGNADSDYMQKSDYIAHGHLTRGVIECLFRII